LIFEIVFFVLACVTTVITLRRKRRIKIPRELLELEMEINEWMKKHEEEEDV